MNRFTLEQRWEILKTYFQSDCCISQTVRKLKINFDPKSAPSAPAVFKFVKKVRELGMLIDNINYPRTRPVLSEENIAAVAESVRQNPGASTRIRSLELKISRTSLRRIMHHLNLDDADIEYLSDTEPKALDINQGEHEKIDSDTAWQSWTPQALKSKISAPLRKKSTKASVRTKFDELGEARLEVVQLQKQVAEAELKYKRIEHEQKTEEHKIRILHLKNEENRRQEEHNYKMQKFMK